MTNWRDGTVNFEQRGVEFPELLVGERHQHRHQQVLPRRGGLAAARVQPAPAHRPGRRGLPPAGRRARLLRHRGRRRDLRPRAHLDAAAPGVQLQLAGLVQRRDGQPAAGQRLFHPGRRRHHGVDPQLVPRGGADLQGRLRRRAEPVPHPLVARSCCPPAAPPPGPVSFMRGADASAGTIKSGGATRRAAKMVVLDVDHPDIEEFVQTKAKEEAKIRVLRDAGFDMDLGGSDIASVQYQNANNSVRVTDEFMHAVESDTEFGLRARQTGEVIDTVDARKLFRGIAQAAWECADPGIQYDGTINDWHTCPESGRITASNPCSEYMHLDNSSCNLASLNLLTFLDDAGRFDAARFQAVGRADHHRDGHLHLLRRLPDRADRRDHPPVPPARHRLRQPRRAADGHRARLRLRGRPRAGRGDHVADDRRGLQALGRAGRRGRPVRRLRPQRRGAPARDAQARRGQRRRPHAAGQQGDPQARHDRLAGLPGRSAPRTAGATRRPRYSRRPAPSA